MDYALALQLMGYERGSDGKAPSVDLANCGYVVFARLPIDSNVPGRVTLRRGGPVGHPQLSVSRLATGPDVALSERLGVCPGSHRWRCQLQGCEVNV